MSAGNFERRKEKQQQLKKQLITLFSMVAFLGTFGYSTMNLFQGAFNQPTQQDLDQQRSNQRQQELQTQERGYEIVLQREPNNQIALEGLVSVRLEMQDNQGAIEGLEKLVKLAPDREDYKSKLAELQAQGQN
ncbi:M48 family metallopeptidase [[Phormidium] sp. ETS-05]|uniref:tetratricopeptide repeat protein n=1 Tax=[Phormidium] sp. ETS-05 TaxID=222819 RepID=UPI0018EEFD75|nr:tetratricopeptide repeat protein [[Phormidium] sp. ETS-05]